MPRHLEDVTGRRRRERIEARVRHPGVVGAGRIDRNRAHEAFRRAAFGRIDARERHVGRGRIVGVVITNTRPRLVATQSVPASAAVRCAPTTNSAAAIGAKAGDGVVQRRTERGPVAAARAEIARKKT